MNKKSKKIANSPVPANGSILTFLTSKKLFSSGKQLLLFIELPHCLTLGMLITQARAPSATSVESRKSDSNIGRVVSFAFSYAASLLSSSKAFEFLFIQGHLYTLYFTLVTGVPWLRFGTLEEALGVCWLRSLPCNSAWQRAQSTGLSGDPCPWNFLNLLKALACFGSSDDMSNTNWNFGVNMFTGMVLGNGSLSTNITFL